MQGAGAPTGQSTGWVLSSPSNVISPMTTSPIAGVSGLNPRLFRKSSAYQSLQPSPIELPCWFESPDVPSGYRTRRFDRPCVYSW